MAEGKDYMALISQLVEEHLKISYRYGITYFEHDAWVKFQSLFSEMRASKFLSGREYHIVYNIYKNYYLNGIKFKKLLATEPRRIAQQFLSNKKVRKAIFSKYPNCLKCGSSTDLTIDHIIPVAVGGANEIDNLQTLCRGCNSSKGTQTVDFRL